jgi:hypothetical protein
VAICGLAAESALGASGLLAANFSGAARALSSTAAGKLDAATVNSKRSLSSGHTTGLNSHVIYYLKIFIFYNV